MLLYNKSTFSITFLYREDKASSCCVVNSFFCLRFLKMLSSFFMSVDAFCFNRLIAIKAFCWMSNCFLRIRFFSCSCFTNASSFMVSNRWCSNSLRCWRFLKMKKRATPLDKRRSNIRIKIFLLWLCMVSVLFSDWNFW